MSRVDAGAGGTGAGRAAGVGGAAGVGRAGAVLAGRGARRSRPGGPGRGLLGSVVAATVALGLGGAETYLEMLLADERFITTGLSP